MLCITFCLLVYQVLSKGGSTPQCTVLFSIRDSNIADVSSSGLLDAQNLGTTTVLGQAVGQDPETGETIIYSQVRIHLYTEKWNLLWHLPYDLCHILASISVIKNTCRFLFIWMIFLRFKILTLKMLFLLGWSDGECDRVTWSADPFSLVSHADRN